MNKLDQIEAALKEAKDWVPELTEEDSEIEQALAAIKDIRDSVPEGLKEAIPYGHKGGLESVIVTKAAKLLLKWVGE